MSREREGEPAGSGGGSQSWSTCWWLIRSDAYRIAGRADTRAVLSAMLRSPSSRYLAVLRVGAWARSTRRRPLLWAVTSLLHRHWSLRYRLEIPFATQVGPGLKISHRIGGVVIASAATIGAGVTLTPGVVIGNNAGRPGAPRIGDGVVVSVGAVVIGDVEIGPRTQVGANSVVTRNLPADVVAAGAPARVLEGVTPHRAAFIDPVDALGPDR